MSTRASRAKTTTTTTVKESSRPAPGKRNVKADSSPTKGKGVTTTKSVPSSPPSKKAPATRGSPRKGNADLNLKESEDKPEKKSAGKPASKTKQTGLTGPRIELERIGNHVSGAGRGSSPSFSSARKADSNNVNANASFKEERSPSPAKTNRKQGDKPKATAPQSRKDSESGQDNGKLAAATAELKRGSIVFSQMSSADLETFLQRLSSLCSSIDIKSHLSRATSLKWDAVAFGIYSGEDLRATWRFLRSCTRTYRIMSELIEEIRLTHSIASFKMKMLEALPGFPPTKRFSTPLQMYLKEKWDRRTEQEKTKFPSFLSFQVEYKKFFDAMSPTEKQSWERESKSARSTHDDEVKEYFRTHPEFGKFKEMYEDLKVDQFKQKKKSATSKGPRQSRAKATKESMEVEYPDAPTLPMNPQAMFINSKLRKLDAEELEENLTQHKLKYSQKWNKLSDKKKSKWIGKCINKCEEYRQAVLEFQETHPGYHPPVFKLVHKVNRTEFGLWETQRGRPPRPPYTVMELFQNQLLEKKDKYKDLTPTQLKEVADAKFNELSANDKEAYRINFKQNVLFFRKGIEEFYNSVPDVAKPSVYSTIPKKFREGLMLPSEMKADHDEGSEAGYTSLIPRSPPHETTQGRKRPISAEFVEDSNSSNDGAVAVAAPKKNKNALSGDHLGLVNLDHRLTLPDIDSDSPPRHATPARKDERSPSPSKKKKKKKQAESDDEGEHVLGIPSHLNQFKTQPQSPTRDIFRERESHVYDDVNHQKKKKKKYIPEPEPEPEIQITYHSKSSDESEEEDDEEEAVVNRGHARGRLPPFPQEKFGDYGDVILSDSSSEDSSSDHRIGGKGKGPAHGHAMTSKEHRDRQIEKYQKKLSR